MPPRQGVAHGEFREDMPARVLRAHQENPAVAGIAVNPAGSLAWGPGAGEVGGANEGARCERVRVASLGGQESSGREDAEEDRRVEGAVAAEERGAGDEAAEGGARCGGADEVRGGGDPDEDLLDKVVGERRRRPGSGPGEDLRHRRRKDRGLGLGTDD